MNTFGADTNEDVTDWGEENMEEKRRAQHQFHKLAERVYDPETGHGGFECVGRQDGKFDLVIYFNDDDLTVYIDRRCRGRQPADEQDGVVVESGEAAGYRVQRLPDVGLRAG